MIVKCAECSKRPVWQHSKSLCRTCHYAKAAKVIASKRPKQLVTPRERQVWLEERFNATFYQDTSGERVFGWLAMNTNDIDVPTSKIATPDDVKRFITTVTQDAYWSGVKVMEEEYNRRHK